MTPEEAEDIASRILYEDNHLLIFNKRSGEMTQGDKTGDEPLPETLKAYIAGRDSKPGEVFLGVPHRLDRPVSGAVVFAKTSKALGRMTEAFRTSDVHKTYWALLTERPSEDAATLEAWLVRNEKMNKSFIRNAPPDGPAPEGAKKARLSYKVIGCSDRYHLVEIDLHTGRHHQIRCQMASMGCPVKGDLKYGAPRSNKDGGICLHARKICFIHPVRKETLTVTAPLPSSWKSIAEDCLSKQTHP